MLFCKMLIFWSIYIASEDAKVGADDLWSPFNSEILWVTAMPRNSEWLVRNNNEEWNDNPLNVIHLGNEWASLGTKPWLRCLSNSILVHISAFCNCICSHSILRRYFSRVTLIHLDLYECSYPNSFEEIKVIKTEERCFTIYYFFSNKQYTGLNHLGLLYQYIY